MGIFDIVKKQFIDVIDWTESEDGVLAYRFPMMDREIQNGAQLTVRETQVAIFVNEGEIAVEAKISDNVKPSDLTGLRSFMSQTSAGKAFVVCLEKRPRLVTTPEGHKIHIAPWRSFLEELWGDNVMA